MNLMEQLNQTDECVTIGRCRISRLLFADDLVLLVSFKYDRPPVRIKCFATACDIAVMRISTSKAKLLYL